MRNFKFLILVLVVFGVFLVVGGVKAQESINICECNITVNLTDTDLPQNNQTCLTSATISFDIAHSVTNKNAVFVVNSATSNLGLNLPSEINSGSDLTGVMDQIVPICLKDIQSNKNNLTFLPYSSTFLNHKFEAEKDCAISETQREVNLVGKKVISCNLGTKLLPNIPIPPKDEKETSFKVPSAESLNKLGTDVPTLIGRVIKTVMGFVGTLALIIFIYAGILWMTAHGNSERQKRAMDTLVWASIGILVILSSYALVNFILKAFI